MFLFPSAASSPQMYWPSMKNRLGVRPEPLGTVESGAAFKSLTRARAGPAFAFTAGGYGNSPVAALTCHLGPPEPMTLLSPEPYGSEQPTPRVVPPVEEQPKPK